MHNQATFHLFPHKTNTTLLSVWLRITYLLQCDQEKKIALVFLLKPNGRICKQQNPLSCYTDDICSPKMPLFSTNLKSISFAMLGKKNPQWDPWVQNMTLCKETISATTSQHSTDISKNFPLLLWLGAAMRIASLVIFWCSKQWGLSDDWEEPSCLGS